MSTSTPAGSPGPRSRGVPEQTLEGLLSVVGAGVLEMCTAPLGLDVPVRGVAVLDEGEPGVLPGQLLLAVGVEPRSAAAADLLRSAGRTGAAGVVFRQDRSGQPGEGLRTVAAQAGVAVFFRTAWTGWSQLVGVVRAGLATSGITADPEIAQVALGDLDGLAEAVAALVGGAVTIEDVRSRVLAYSSTDGVVDEIRRLTILGRRVPQWRIAAMEEAGFFRALWGSGDVVHRPAEGEVPERLAMAVSAGGEVLGSVWVAAAGRPLPPTAADALRAAARAAAPHLLHHRSRLAGRTMLAQEAARALLEGRGSAEVLEARTALPREGRCAVLAVRVVAGPGDDEAGGRLPDLSALHCAAQGHQVVIVPVGRDVLVLLGDLAKDAERAAAQVSRLGESLARRLSTALGGDVRIGVGEVRPRLDQAPASRHAADLALRALLFAGSARVCARVDQLTEAVAMLQVLDVVGELSLPPDTPVARLAGYDAQHGGGALVGTLRAYLDHFGDVPAASRALNVHANTFRYRLRRLREVCGIELDDPDARLLAQLQLRLMSRAAAADS
ncbi:hypothetical protein ACZ90_30425 [Streptomyces albus subsp. albus]|nr:hypothetical protein ACZ90_30425 [Streptomyces albus subsp. albus]